MKDCARGRASVLYSMLCATPMACSIALTSAWKLLTIVLPTSVRHDLRARSRRIASALATCAGRSHQTALTESHEQARALQPK